MVLPITIDIQLLCLPDDVLENVFRHKMPFQAVSMK